MQSLVRAFESIDAWGENLLRYMRKHGYDTDSTRAMLRRAFFECWAQPGFDRFWRVWNPVYGYGLLRLYRWLGGNTHPLRNRLIVFIFCGFVLHDMLALLLVGKPQLSTTLAFVFYGSAAFLSRRYRTALRQETWPMPINVCVNLVLVATGTALGVFLQRVLF